MKNIDESNVEDLKDNEEEETSKNEEEEKDYKELYENQRIRAEKAEKKAKELEKIKEKSSKKEEKKDSTSKQESTLSVKDSARLQQANIPVDDWDDVIEYANFKGISVSEALGSSVVKATLAEKEETRNTAKATNTGKGKQGSSKISGSNALEKARAKGIIPDREDELDALLEERYSV